MRSELFIDGQFVPAVDERTFDSVSPRDGSVLAAVARGDAHDIDHAVRAARASFERGDWAYEDPAVRGRVLVRLSELMLERLEELAQLESRDTGHPIGDARGVDVPGAARCFAWYGEAVDKVYGEIAPTAADAIALISREPLGVVGAVVPWNYPLIISAWKLAPALAAGNSVVLKPAEQSPLSALALAELAAEAGVPDGVLNVVPGYGEEAGQALGRHMDVDKVAFTGSVPVGRMFQRYAGESNGKQVSLELGGKSPQVVLADTPDLEAAAESIAWGIFYNAGQTCHAGSRVVVERAVREELLFRLGDAARGFVPADPALDSTVLGAMISTEHLAGVLRRVEAAVRRWRAGHRRRHGSRAGRRRRLHGPDPDRGRLVRPGRRPGGGVRPRTRDPGGRRRRSRAEARQRHALRARGRGLDLRRPHGGPSGAAFARGHRMDQHVRRLVARDSVRRFQAVGPRPRPLAARARRLHAAEDDLDLARMTRVAFVGLGHMGSHMCRHVVAGGYDVSGYDLDRTAVRRAVRAGARGAKSVPDCLEAAEVLITSLPGPPQVEAVLGEALPLLAPGSVAIEMSTSSLEVARRLVRAGALA